METKQVIVIAKYLNMRKGKCVAQGAHASMKVFFDRMKQVSFAPGGAGNYLLNITSEMTEWVNGKFTKICVSADSEKQLLDIYNKALAANLPCSLIRDSGLTEFSGVPTLTAVAIGPDDSDAIDKITGDLPLL